jgi:hypothetical protein
MLAVSGGCSSSSRGPEPITESRRETPVVAAEAETRDQDRGYAINGDRTAETSMNRSDGKTVRTATPATDTGVAGAAEQHGRVTMVSSQPPPLTRAEIPSHEPRDGEFWVAGQWRGESGQYVWQAGRIERDRPGQLFVPANWVPSPRGWEYSPEYWR